MVSLLGGIITLLSYAFPCNIPRKYIWTYIWIWGLRYNSKYENQFFLNFELFSQISIFNAVAIGILAGVAIVKGNKSRKGKEHNATTLIVSAVLVLVFAGMWALIAHVMLQYVKTKTSREGGYEITETKITYFWGYNTPFLGLILLFVGGFITLIGGILEAVRKK